MIINAKKHLIAYFNIRKILQMVQYEPQTTREKLAYSIIYSNYDSQDARGASHLTDSTPLEGQIRFLLQSELNHLFRDLIMNLPPKIITIHNSTALSKSEQHFFSLLKEFRSKFTIDLNEEIFTELPIQEIQSVLTETEEAIVDFLENTMLSEKENEADFFSVIICAERAIYNRDYETAIQLLHRIEFYYKHPSISWFLGIGYNFFEDTQQSEKYFYQVYNSGDVNKKINACYTLSMLYLRHHPNSLIDIEKGKDLLNEALRLIDNDSEVTNVIFNRVFNRNGYALYLYRKGRVKEAIELLEWGIERLKSSDFLAVPLHISVLYYNLFQCYRAQGNLEQQLNALNELLLLDPRFEAYLLEKAIVCSQLELPDVAIDILQKVLTDNPYNDTAHSLLGKCYYDQKKMNRAEKHFYKAIKLNPSDTKYLYDLLLILRLEKKGNRILSLVDELAINCWDIDNVAIVLMYTEALVQSNKISNHQKAKKILTDHLQTNPNEIQIQKALTSIIQ